VLSVAKTPKFGYVRRKVNCLRAVRRVAISIKKCPRCGKSWKRVREILNVESVSSFERFEVWGCFEKSGVSIAFLFIKNDLIH
jgi:hypothetical protein